LYRYIEAEEAAGEARDAGAGGAGGGKAGEKARVRAKPLDAAAAKAELEKRAEVGQLYML
jgi:hypothetical protein